MTSMDASFPASIRAREGEESSTGAARNLQRRVLEGKSAELAVKLDLTLLADRGQGRRPWIPRCAQAMRERPRR